MKVHGLLVFLLASLTLGLIGPVLSYFTLQSQGGYSQETALAYAATSYLLDVLSVVLFALFLRSRFGLSVKRAFYVSTVAYVPLWIFDLFDAYQQLRFLSNGGLLVSLLYLKRKLESGFAGSAALFAFLYVVDALVAESIASSSLFKEVIGGISPHNLHG